MIWHSKQGSGTSNNYYYLHRDYLGSILAITDENGNFKEKRHFDAWGNIVKLEDGNGNSLSSFKILDRGYTGHEHLLGVGIIHMNGRLYDPMLHRFLSPDNFVQNRFNTQNYNRYGYVLNNPLMYKDESGEFFTIFTAIFEGVKNIFTHGVNFDHYDWHRTQMAWRIDMGMFKTDSNRTFFGQFWQFVSRYTWELPQTAVGYFYSHSRNLAGEVDEVEYFGGATCIINENTDDQWGLSLGNYINVNLRKKFKKHYPGGWIYSERGLFWHEYGHTFQSQRYGFLYLPVFGLSSITGAEWTETSANRWAWRYADQFNYMNTWFYSISHPLN